MQIVQSLLILSLLAFFSNINAQEKHRLIFSDEVLFGPGQSDIQSIYKARLDTIIKRIQEDPEVEKIILQANTDSVGSFESNEKLSFKRAESIVTFLKANNVDENLLEIRTYGEFNPIADNTSAEGRARNRRVSIHVLGRYDPDKYNIQALIKGQLLDANTNAPLPNSRVLMLYLGGMDTLITDEEGRFEKDFNYMTNVEVRAYAKNYFFVSKLVTLKSKQTEELSFSLEPAIIGGKMFLSDLYFKPGAAFLLPSSERALEGILSFMQYNDQLKFEIGGHINRPNEDPVPVESSSFKLSEARAKAVFLYLHENGIVKERLGYKGYGNSEMIKPNAISEIEQQMNRRVELKIMQ
jgi:outer membrane protein OmpA-like peptidoglycan-associated protein